MAEKNQAVFMLAEEGKNNVFYSTLEKAIREVKNKYYSKTKNMRSTKEMTEGMPPEFVYINKDPICVKVKPNNRYEIDVEYWKDPRDERSFEKIERKIVIIKSEIFS